MAAMKILNFGSLNLDYVYRVAHSVQPGETIASSGMETFCGGKGLNQSVALARAGAEVYHAGRVGEDGQLLIETCWQSGVHTELILQTNGKSGHTIIQVDDNGQNSILLAGGANRRITEQDVDTALRAFGAGDLLLLQNEISCLPVLIERAYEKGMRVVLNPSPCDETIAACDLKKVSMLLLNEIEAAQITGETEQAQIEAAFARRYPQTQILLTLGGSGSRYLYGEERYAQGVFDVTPVDTTAAGDTYTGYFLAALAEGQPVPACMKLAAKASAIAVTRPGASPSIPWREEVERAQLQELPAKV